MQPSIIYFYLLSICAIEHRLYSIKANISRVRYLKEGLRQPGEGYTLLSIRLFVSHVFSIETPRATHLARLHHERCVSDAITIILISYGLATLTKPQWRSQKNTQRFDRESIGTTDAKKNACDDRVFVRPTDDGNYQLPRLDIRSRINRVIYNVGCMRSPNLYHGRRDHRPHDSRFREMVTTIISASSVTG